MLIKKAEDIRSSEITPKSLYLNRRKFLAEVAMAGAAAAIGVGLKETISPSTSALAGNKIDGIKKSSFSTTETVTPYKDVTHYNNYYEFGTEKDEPAEQAKNFRTRPWKVKIDGHGRKETGTGHRHHSQDGTSRRAHLPSPLRRRMVDRCSLGRLFSQRTDQESESDKQGKVRRVYDLVRPFADARPAPSGAAVAVRRRPAHGRGHEPSGLLCFGMYGEDLPNQDGAPLRIVLPWKYGFKSAKAIVRIHFTEKQPLNSWNISAPQEYGFYANVNPNVDHPRWSQAKERRLGEFLKRPTLMFNGYGDQVASLYSGMDLKKNY